MICNKNEMFPKIYGFGKEENLFFSAVFDYHLLC